MKTWTIILLRSIGIFIISFAAIRIMGKRQISRMTPFYFVTYAVIAILAALISANIITNLAFGLITLGVWILLPIGIDYISMKSKWLHDVIQGRETILVKSGKIMEENLKQMRLTGDELLRELRSKNVFNLADVEFAIMEPTGEMNVLFKSDKKPITPHDLEQKVAPQEAPKTVIIDGNIIDEALGSIGLNRAWLKSQLEGMGISLDNVFMGQVDSLGDLYIDLFDDSIQVSQPKVKELLYANLEKCQTDLVSFALDTQDSNIKTVYSNDAEELQKVLDKLRIHLLR